MEVLDLSAGWDSLAKFDIVIRRLKRLGLHSNNLLFCPANWQQIGTLGFEKQDEEDEHACLQCATETDIHDKRAERNMALEICEFTQPALIVFKRSMLEKLDEYRYLPLLDVPLQEAALIIFLLTSDDF